MLADKAYDVDWIREMIWEQGTVDVIPSRANRKVAKDFDAEIYKPRYRIERLFGRLKASFRRIAAATSTPTAFCASSCQREPT